MTAGAILAGAKPDEVKACEIYAEKIGLAFQSIQNKMNCNLFSILNKYIFLIVADDILDVTATSEELGKTAGKDENTNKTTYVKLLGLEKSKSEVMSPFLEYFLKCRC